MRNWTHIMLHHSLTKDGQTVSWQAIRRYHKDTMGWDDIGYHYGIELVNTEYEILVGRPIDRTGAHCVGMNEEAIGICLVGNFDEQDVPEAQWECAVRFVRSLKNILNVPVDNIVAHREYAPKSCPGTRFDLDKFKNEVNGL